MLGVVGLLARPIPGLDLNGELRLAPNLPALFSSALLLAASLAAGCLAREGGSASRAWWGMALVLLFMGLDEALSIHESAESASGVEWQLLYLPVAIVAAAAWALVLRRLPPVRRLRLRWVLGAAAWVVAQGLEPLEWDGGIRTANAPPLEVVEEILEMAGTALWLLVAFELLLAARRRGAPSESAESG